MRDVVDRLIKHLRKAGKKRWEGKTDEEKKAVASKGGNAAWAGMTAEEKSAEMKRRAAKRKKKGK